MDGLDHWCYQRPADISFPVNIIKVNIYKVNVYKFSKNFITETEVKQTTKQVEMSQMEKDSPEMKSLSPYPTFLLKRLKSSY